MPSLDQLNLREGAEPTVAQLRALSENIDAQTPMVGPQSMRSTWPWGYTETVVGTGGGGGVSPTFAPGVERRGGQVRISFERGVIGGVEPKIEGRVISAKPQPSYTIPDEAYGANGEARVYWQLNLDHNFWAPAPGGGDGRPDAVECAAFPGQPQQKAWTAFKLAAIVSRKGEIRYRALYSDLGYIAYNRRTGTGFAEHIFWAL